jgi:multidrug transporter EmrE-like cation transporter
MVRSKRASTTDTSLLVSQAYAAWTSIGHMILVAASESGFDTILETDDVLEMSTFERPFLL